MELNTLYLFEQCCSILEEESWGLWQVSEAQVPPLYDTQRNHSYEQTKALAEIQKKLNGEH